ncbi:MAG: hypothetical protein AB7N76_08075 [Planctomycetota bacterium]
MPRTEPAPAPVLRSTTRARRCSYCHDGAPARFSPRCRRCGTVVHESCAAELERCPTLGCGAFEPAPLPLWLRALDLALCSLVAGGAGAVVLYACARLLFGTVSAVRANAFPIY